MRRLRLAPVTAVTCDAAMTVVVDAAIHTEGSRITYVGPMAAAPAFLADETMGGDHLVALPGLVNTHTHAAMTLLRGYADDMALEPWLREKIWPAEAHLTEDDIYAGTMLAILEMLRGGTTCCADMYFGYERNVHAYIESGMRACPSGVLLGFLPGSQKRIANAVAFVREYREAGEGRIKPCLGPHSLYTCDREQWRTMVAAAHNLKVPLQTHAAESLREVADVTAQWGTPPVQTLHDLGALDGPLLAAHCVHLADHEMELVDHHRDPNGFTNLRVSHNPTSNLKLASGFAPVPRYLAAGITCGLGTDGAASNNNLDMWQEMRLAALLHKATTGDPSAVPAERALLMATREGARCLGLEESIGSLETGKQADVLLVDFDKHHLTPRHNVVSHLVYSAAAADVDTVIVDGKVLMAKGQFRQLDAAAISAAATAAAAKFMNGANYERT